MTIKLPSQSMVLITQTPAPFSLETIIGRLLPAWLQGEAKTLLGLLGPPSKNFDGDQQFGTERYLEELGRLFLDEQEISILSPEELNNSFFYFDKFKESHNDLLISGKFIALSVIGCPDNVHLISSVSNCLHSLGQTQDALRWSQSARIMQSKKISSLIRQDDSEFGLYCILLMKESFIFSALGFSIESLRIAFIYFALTLEVDFNVICELLSNPPFVLDVSSDDIMDDRVDLPSLFTSVMGVKISNSILEPATQPYEGGIIYNIDNVNIFNDYWRICVFDSRGDIVRGISRSPEFVALAYHYGFRFPSFHLAGRVALVSNRHGWSEYYHWLIEIMPRMGILSQYGLIDYLIAPGATTRKYCNDFFKISGLIDQIKIIGDEGRLAFSVESLIVPETHLSGRLRHEYARQIFLGPNKSDASRRIFISRQKAPLRRIINEIELFRSLEYFGFESVILENLSVSDQAQIMAAASIIVAPHGAGLSNIIFCEENATVVELLPSQCPACYRDLSEQLGLRYIAIPTDRSDQDIVANCLAVVDAVKRLLNLDI